MSSLANPEGRGKDRFGNIQGTKRGIGGGQDLSGEKLGEKRKNGLSTEGAPMMG